MGVTGTAYGFVAYGHNDTSQGVDWGLTTSAYLVGGMLMQDPLKRVVVINTPGGTTQGGKPGGSFPKGRPISLVQPSSVVNITVTTDGSLYVKTSGMSTTLGMKVSGTGSVNFACTGPNSLQNLINKYIAPLKPPSASQVGMFDFQIVLPNVALVNTFKKSPIQVFGQLSPPDSLTH